MTTTTRPSAKSFPRVPQPAVVAAARPAYHQYRARDFGIGYGRSSGYASGKRYVDNWGNARFQCG
ncbi:MAG TPA: hypothetical protein VM619_12185 [Luteimonas sp.]|nr:hypothetical protein [Luteimonas sp.]